MNAADAASIADTQPRPVPPVEGFAPGTVAAWLDWATRTLEGASPSARADAQVLMAAQLDLPRAHLHLRMDDPILAARVLRYAAAVERRRVGEPVAYLTGHQGFWTLELKVNPSVLIPRADTETLVEWALELARTSLSNVIPAKAGIQSDVQPAASEALDSRLRGNDGIEGPRRVLDLGTGSGAIALALAWELGAGVQLVATDYSDAAVNSARDNARELAIDSVQFLCGDWFEALRGDDPERFDLIVSNPPYIAEGDSHLVDLRYEPRRALTSGVEGLDAIRTIVDAASTHLHAHGWLLLEHGRDQAAAVRDLLTRAGFCDVQTRRDFGGNERVSGGRKP